MATKRMDQQLDHDGWIHSAAAANLLADLNPLVSGGLSFEMPGSAFQPTPMVPRMLGTDPATSSLIVQPGGLGPQSSEAIDAALPVTARGAERPEPSAIGALGIALDKNGAIAPMIVKAPERATDVALAERVAVAGEPVQGNAPAAAGAMTTTFDAPVTTAAVLADAEEYFATWGFTNDLPIAARIEADRPGTYVLEMKQSEQWLGLRDGDGNELLTTIWGYGLPGHDATYPGPTIVAHEGQPIQLNWKNMLPTDGHLLPADTSFMLADPARMTIEEGYVPTVVHLHGGHTAPGSDGLPEAWYTQHHAEVGPDYVQRIVDYENDQQAATLWYHDHALGFTRLNVYSGLAGFYLLRDGNEEQLIADGVLPGGKYEIEMAIQDRAFTTDGHLYLPAYADDPIPGTDDTVKDTLPEDPDDPGSGFSSYPTIVPEFFGDFILVNGMAWPKLEVDAGDYRFRMLDGSDSRFYLLQLDNPNVKVTLVGGDGGLLPNAVTVMDGDGLQEPGEQLVIAPGDRLDLVFDFSGTPGETVTLLNVGPAYEPFKGLNPDGSLAGGEEPVASAAGTPVGEIMQFVVGGGDGVDTSVADGTVLNTDYVPRTTTDIDNTRMLGLFEGVDEHGRILPQLGVAEESTDENGESVSFGPLDYADPITERPLLGDTELWQIFNFTADAHPVHLHLTQFDVLERYKISFEDADEDGLPDDVSGDGLLTIGMASDNEALRIDDVLVGDRIDLLPTDSGAQDTSWVGAGEMIGIAATFDMLGEYVWHCHILSHEEHDMMRPFEVIDKLPVG